VLQSWLNQPRLVMRGYLVGGLHYHLSSWWSLTNDAKLRVDVFRLSIATVLPIEKHHKSFEPTCGAVA
jgi:hypothetical protein